MSNVVRMPALITSFGEEDMHRERPPLRLSRTFEVIQDPARGINLCEHVPLGEPSDRIVVGPVPYRL